MCLELCLLATGPHLVSASDALSNQSFVSPSVQCDLLQESVDPFRNAVLYFVRLYLRTGNVIRPRDVPAKVPSYGWNVAKVHSLYL